MDPLMIFALTLVALVALGSHVHGRLNGRGTEISTYLDEKGDQKPDKKTTHRSR